MNTFILLKVKISDPEQSEKPGAQFTLMLRAVRQPILGCALFCRCQALHEC